MARGTATPMTPDDGTDRQPDHRHSRDVPADAISLRQPEDEDGVFDVRMPIATTGEVRNEGDDPLEREALEGMARQISQRTVGVFLDHGRSPVGGRERYSAVEKVGEWVDADVRERDASREADGDERQADTDELVATARLMDPEDLPAATGTLREALASIKEQVQRGFSLSASIGWRDDEDFPGGVDLMEVSIVGIGADPRTTSDAETAVVARAAVEAGADPDHLLAQVRSAVASERPLGPPEDPERFDTFEECVQALMDDEDIDRESAERICGSWEAAKEDSSNHDMTDEDTESAEEADDTTEQDEQPDETQDEAAEFRERMLELQEAQMETLEAVAEAVRQEDEDDDEDDEEEDDDEESSAEEPDEGADEQSAEGEDEDARELREEISELRESLADLRDGGFDAEDVDTGEEPDDEQSADDQPDDDTKHELTNKYGIEP